MKAECTKQRFGTTVFPRIIAGGDYFFFRTKRGQLFEGRRLLQILLTGSRALNVLCFIMPLNKKYSYQTRLTEHGFFKCSKFSSLINFHTLNRHLSVLLDHLALTLDREGIKGR